MSQQPIDCSPFPLTAEHRMLLDMRDTLYEGVWEDFVRDLRARLEQKPHIYRTVPESPEMKTTVVCHLSMIEKMQRWEMEQGHTLRSSAKAPVDD